MSIYFGDKPQTSCAPCRASIFMTYLNTQKSLLFAIIHRLMQTSRFSVSVISLFFHCRHQTLSHSHLFLFPSPLIPSTQPHQLLKPLGRRALSIWSWVLLHASMFRYLKMWNFPLEQICAGGICRGLLSSEMICRCRKCR